MRLTAHDWAVAALDALGRGGLAAIAVEPIAARLGATKGSFYWHFANRDALIAAALAEWERAHTEGTITRIDAAESDPGRRLRLLLTTVIAAAESERTEAAVLAAAAHPLVAPVLARVTARRIAYVAGLFAALGFDAAEARRRGLLAYTAYLGHAQLAHAVPGQVPGTERESRDYADRVIALLTGP